MPFLVTAAVADVQTGIVLGASVKSDGTLSTAFADRMDVAISWLQEGKIDYLLISGDDTDPYYREVSSALAYVEQSWLDRGVVLTDEQWLDTYDSLRRAKEVYEIDEAVIFTQRFHLLRSIYLARSFGLAWWGVSTDVHSYMNIGYFKLREIGATLKALWEIYFWPIAYSDA